jgi:tRNA (guanine-N(7)-)-methyltransferase
MQVEGFEFTPEILSMFDPRYLEHRAEDLERFAEVRQVLQRPVRAVEIGCNRGEYLIGLARTYPNDLVVGFEWRGKYARFAEDRLARHHIENALVIHGDARLGIFLLFGPAAIGEVHVTFPDPWWRKRHEGRRVLEPLFMRALARRLVVGGRLYLRSDVFDYLYRVRMFAQISAAFDPLPARLWPDESSWSLTTRETKCRDGAIPYGKGYYRVRDDFSRVLPAVGDDPAEFQVDEDIDPVELIRGAPPVDREARIRSGGRRRS